MSLKPCPFCGSMATIHCDIPRLHAYGYGVGCSNPNCTAYSGYGMMTCETKEEAVAAWNRRAKPESDAGGAFDEQRYSKVCRLLEQALSTMSEWGTNSD